MPQPGLPQYDAIRQRLKSQFGEKKQEQTDAIQRRFAANGMAGSGAYGKAQDQASQQVGRDEADATAQLDFAEANESQRRQELAEGRQYQTSERLGTQQFNEGMFNKDLDFKKAQFSDQFGEQKRQFDQEFGENQKSNRASALINLVGDDIGDYDKVKSANDWLNSVFGGDSGTSFTAPKKPVGHIATDSFGRPYSTYS